MKRCLLLWIWGLFILMVACKKDEPVIPVEVNYIQDFDGNKYGYITIANQVWTITNLNTMHFRNGDVIPFITSADEWQANTGPACCLYKHDATDRNVYGLLYNFAAVTDPRGLCPAGWHVASLEEWEQLIDTLGGFQVAGGFMKEKGNKHWANPNTGATNSTGFTAVPGGYCSMWGGFDSRKYYGYYWTSTVAGPTESFYYYQSYDNAELSRCYCSSENAGFAVRMIHD